MKKFKHVLNQLPEYYLIVLALLTGYAPPFVVHPLAIALSIILLLQVIFKNRIAGLLIGNVFLIGNIYMLGALIFELYEFQSFNSNAWQLLIGGSLLLVFHLFICKTMFNPLYHRKSKLAH